MLTAHAEARDPLAADHLLPSADDLRALRAFANHAVSVESRILAVADAYEAMTADRSYRTGMDAATARLLRAL
jgi:hypothetical protein